MFKFLFFYSNQVKQKKNKQKKNEQKKKIILILFFFFKTSDGVTEITCPQIGCKREVILKDLEQILPFSELKKLKRFRNAKNPNIRFCPKCDNPNSKEQAPLQYSTENEMECSKCHHKYCFFHSDAHPLTVSCESYEQVLRQSPEEIQTSKLLSETTKPCPGCQRPVELSEGCPLVKCSGCKLKVTLSLFF